jgi:hypothetical protein
MEAAVIVYELPVRGTIYRASVDGASARFVAKCLDVHVAAYGETKTEALEALKRELDKHRPCMNCGGGEHDEYAHEDPNRALQLAQWCVDTGKSREALQWLEKARKMLREEP